MKTEGKYFCGSCESYFDDMGRDGYCPKCGSGNWIFGCPDDDKSKPDVIIVGNNLDSRKMLSELESLSYNVMMSAGPIPGNIPANDLWLELAMMGRPVLPEISRPYIPPKPMRFGDKKDRWKPKGWRPDPVKKKKRKTSAKSRRNNRRRG